MAYGEYNGPDKPNKGREGGACNRSLCQAEPANWYNHGSYSWYCEGCRNAIQFDPINLRHWQVRWEPECGHPQFETREQMNTREADAALLTDIFDKMAEVVAPLPGIPDAPGDDINPKGDAGQA